MRLVSIVLITIFSTCCICLAQDSPKDYIDAHNKARAEVGVGPLSWSKTLESYAQNYANKMVKDCNMVHSGGPYGENLAGSSGDITAPGAVKLWVEEKANYDPNSNSCVNNGECLHYTQVVWNETFDLGCGKAKCDNGWTYVVCSYDPPGNFVGQKPY
ncbi:basic form of pathogenesis-related protein 1-like [Abrus precatorius]|uniref:Basic form of pathogenesis-related protein 1-like n=1 Tax=Abrus precatorius TaxID=3816 RepID=A0A8B8KWZ1_ABRPR|nr:basic form of pathogenesis-related protein 1-like [Abrus precatorius]